ncbi:restriction endonuclease subunit S [Telluria aromaticivorans]|uniref:Restriction endonuclease subunit S n=1 Tax=Telluria aromaticivorans TaxID=2725995 RepID=A0A7Y2JXK2_9BURK|nr:restriction endonuclease subunit S [Telluria aromaticivorans]NNG22761.1 restriction endonuclease subunit S [Telluria aromaticivorans]
MSAIQQLLTDHIDIWTAAETEKKSGRGRASGSAAGVYGIKKMRELILELAVRGKLVPQDVNDEPASELLKRIQIEKAKLLDEGKIKNGKLLDQDVVEEMPFTLPTGWAYSRLGNVVDIIRGITFPGSEKTKVPADGRVACLRTSNVQDQIEWHDILYIREEFVSRDDQILMPRDIVMSMANSRELVGKVALVGSTINQRTSFGGFLGVLRPYLIEPRFVMALLRTPHTREALIDSASQTTNIANISLAKLRPLFFAIPPLAEQHRIVAKVDELMALCDQLEAQHSDAADAHEQLVSYLLGTITQSQSAADFNANWQRIAAHFGTLFTTEASIDALKQALLQLAVMGKLVAQDANDEPASELLKRIQAEKSKLVAEGKIRKDKPQVATPEDQEPFELPPGWAWSRLSNIATILSGHGFNSEDFNNESGAKVIKITNAGVYEFIESSDYLPENFKIEYPRYIVNEGDLILALTRPYISTGLKISQCPPSYNNSLLNQRVAAIKPNCEILNRYLFTFLKSPHVLKIYQDKFGNSGLQPNLKVSDVSELIVAIPPQKEQPRIVAKMQEFLEICDQLMSRITTADQHQKKLADALVEQAVAT